MLLSKMMVQLVIQGIKMLTTTKDTFRLKIIKGMSFHQFQSLLHRNPQPKDPSHNHVLHLLLSLLRALNKGLIVDNLQHYIIYLTILIFKTVTFNMVYQFTFTSRTTTASPCQQRTTTISPCQQQVTDHPDIAEWKRTIGRQGTEWNQNNRNRYQNDQNQNQVL